jgi:hypothetical protein
MAMSLARLSGLVLVGVSLLGAGCAAIPVPVPVASTGSYYYDPIAKSLTVNVSGSNEKLNPASLYIYTVTVTKRGSDEYILNGHVTDGMNAEPMRAHRGAARATVHLTDLVPGTYKFIDSSTGKVAGTIDTSAPSPPYTDPV